jgi:hypothetical protein
MKNLSIFEINTTAFTEENFILLTNLTEQQIKDVIYPIVNAEREKGEFYDNELLVQAINEVYPKNVALLYTKDGLDLITI